MAANTAPVFKGLPLSWPGILTTETSRDAPSSPVTIVTGGDDGSVVQEYNFQCTDVTLAALIFVWLHDGSTYYLLDEFDIDPVPTVNNTTEAFHVQYTSFEVIVPEGWTLRMAETINQVSGGDTHVVCRGGDF